MCMGGSKPEPAPTPAPAPAPPADPPTAPVVNEKTASQQTLLSSNRAGRSSLRINRASADPTGGSGLNIPV